MAKQKKRLGKLNDNETEVFLENSTIIKVKSDDKYEEWIEEDKECFSNSIRFTVHFVQTDKEYEVEYWHYYDHYDVYDPDLTIKEITKKHSKKVNLYNFLNSDEEWDLFWDVFCELKREVEYEYHSYERYVELKEYEKIQKRMYRIKKHLM